MGEARAYYNEIEPAAAHVLRALIADGVIAPGDVDTRSIKDVQPDDLAGYTQAHFFAGGGLWSVAARLAGWPDDRPLWTGSCPCQPFSGAGKGLGTDDPRHLWPDFFRLIRGARAAGFGPPVVMGEQVSKKAGYHWLDGVRADLASEGYACRARDIPALAVDAPHERNRLYWIAVDDGQLDGPHQSAGKIRAGRIASDLADAAVEHAAGDGRQQGIAGTEAARYGREPAAADRGIDGPVCDLALAERRGCEGWNKDWRGAGAVDASDRPLGRYMADRDEFVRRIGDEQPTGQQPLHEHHAGDGVRAWARNGSFWSDAEWLVCHDGKARRTKPGLRLLSHGIFLPLDLLRRECASECQEEVIAHVRSSRYRNPAEALLAVWRAYEQEALPTKQRAGMCGELPEAALLLDFVRNVLAACAAGFHDEGLSAAGPADDWAELRSVLDGSETPCPSRGREPSEQRPIEPSNSLRELSRLLACRAETVSNATRKANAEDHLSFSSGRVGLWRIAGNAIVPELAAEVIRAFMETEGLRHAA